MNSVPGVMQLESKGGSSGTFSPAARAFSSSALIQNHQLVEETTADRVCVLCILRRAKPTLPLLVHFGSWGNAVNGHVYKLFGSRNIEQLVEVFEDSREHLLFPVKQYCHRRIECDGSRSEHEGKEKRASKLTSSFSSACRHHRGCNCGRSHSCLSTSCQTRASLQRCTFG